VALQIFLIATWAAKPLAQAQTFTVLYSFAGGADGANPVAGLIRDGAGNLYGTTSQGGAFGDWGTVFKLDTTGKETVLYSFSGGADGGIPYAGLIGDAKGNLYGTTSKGGLGDSGTVFKLTLNTTGKYEVLHSFNGADGANPSAGLIRDAAGNLYGTARFGGAYDVGTLFKLDATGKETVLHSFTSADGAYPYAGLMRDVAGNLYGTTPQGGNGTGTVVRLLNKTGKYEVLYRFTGAGGGASPFAGLIPDAAGNLYGVTYYGGASDLGAVFALDSTGKEIVLHSFIGADGVHPVAGVIRDAAGNLYGTARFGGTYDCGTLFKLDAIGTYEVLHTFTCGADGAFPIAGLIRDASGNLYGTTANGGAFENGTVFKLTP
jgi:uncharacterized repeat protein (TIGR03803 family)